MPLVLQTLDKIGAETRRYSMDFGALLDTDETIITVVSVTDSTPGSDSLTLGSASISEEFVEFNISGGEAFNRHTITVTIETSLGNTLVGVGELRIIEE